MSDAQQMECMIESLLQHSDKHCALVERRIACDDCGYPPSEAAFVSVDAYLQRDAVEV